MKKFMESLSKPMTWGSYWKMCGIIYVISIVLGIASIAVIYHNEVKKAVKNMIEDLKGNKNA